MTLIEFFEKDAIENICSALIMAPERVLLIGDKCKRMKKHAERYKAVLMDRGVDVEFGCLAVQKNNIQSIIETLTIILEKNDDCVFDLTGGEDLFLTAVGIVLERFKSRKIQAQRLNIRNNMIIDGDGDGHTISAETMPTLSVSEIIRIYGGRVIYDDQQKGKTYRWDMNDEFKFDINTMWSICRENVRHWNTQICVLEAAEELSGFTDQLSVSVSTGWLKDQIEQNGGKFVLNRRILNALHNAGLIEEFHCDEDMFSVTYKNEQVKRCLTLAGRVLEMKVFLAALESTETDGSPTYSDVMNGVCIDWDGDDEEQSGYDTENEIDVMMTHGMVPVFVSCKNGYVDNEELYKLNAVATRFGGNYAKKVLIVTSLDDSDSSEYFRQRAANMGIRLVEGYSRSSGYIDLTQLNDAEFNRIIRSLWSS